MKNFTKYFMLFTLLSFVFSSCGVIFGGSRFNGTIVAKDHPNAQISVNGNQLGKGSTNGSFKRNQPLVVMLKQDGCESKTQTFDNTFRTGNFILSVITWGILGIAVDLGTGAAYKPDSTHDHAIQQRDIKNFAFTVDYSGCTNK